MRHSYSCQLRWSDMDAFGHVNNVVFLRYLEEARVDLMFRAAREMDPESFASGVVVARHEVDYLRPLVYRTEPVTVETWVSELGAASATLGYEIREPGAVEEDGPGRTAGPYVRAESVIVPYDVERGRPRRISAAEKAFLKGFQDDSHRG